MGGREQRALAARLWRSGPVLRVSQGDITRCRADVLVNAANETLCGSSGRTSAWHFAGKRNVDSAVHQVGGPRVLEECQRIRPLETALDVRCHAGDAVITNAHGKLLAKFVVHAVGPYFFGGDTNQDSSPEAQMLANAYLAALARAQTVRAQSICFPAISCGVRNCPHTLGAKIALTTVAAALLEGRGQGLGLLSRVEFVLAAKDALGLWQAELRALSVARSWDLAESDR